MLTGLEAVDWAAMEHAEGSTVDVPDLLRDMAGTDPAVRGPALRRFRALLDNDPSQIDDMLYVFDWAVACTPFLAQLAVRPDAADRVALLEILASVGGIGEEGFFPAGQYADELLRSSRTAIAAVVPDLIPFLDDGSPAVRCPLARVLVAAARYSDAVLPTLRCRFAVEPDAELRSALLRQVAWAATLRGSRPGRAEALAWLEERLAELDDPLEVLDLIGAMLLADVEVMPGRIVTAVVRELDRLGEVVDGRETPTTLMIVNVDQHWWRERDRVAPEELLADPDRPWWFTAPLWTIEPALEHRLPERVELLLTLLGSPRWFVRYTACDLATGLIDTWRGDHRELMLALLAHLDDPDPRVAKRAGIAKFAPVLDVLLPMLDDPATTTAQAALMVAAVAETGDPRLAPIVRQLLAADDLPPDLRPLLAVPGVDAGELPDPIHQRIVDPTGQPGGAPDPRVSELAQMFGDRAAPVAGDLVALLDAGARPEVVIDTLLACWPPPVDVPAGYRDDWSGPLHAARSLWRVTGDAGPALDLLERALATLKPDDRVSYPFAVELAADLGPVAAPFLPRLLRDARADTLSAWTHLRAGVAAWRITGRAQPAVDLLVRAVELNEWMLLVPAANCLAEIGPTARDAEPVLRRYLPTPGRVEPRPYRPAREDHQRIAACVRALARISAG